MEHLTFQCWKCEQEFGFSLDLETKPALLTTCPYCGSDCAVDFEPYRKPEITITRGAGYTLEELALPAVIPMREKTKSHR